MFLIKLISLTQIELIKSYSTDIYDVIKNDIFQIIVLLNCPFYII